MKMMTFDCYYDYVDDLRVCGDAVGTRHGVGCGGWRLDMKQC